MIYVLTSYSIIAKKALGEKCFQASIEKVKKLLPFDPIDSNIEALIIGPKDINGLKGNSINEAINYKHERIMVIYIYQKDEEEFLVDTSDLFRYKIEKPSPNDIEEIITEVLSKDNKQKIIDAMFGSGKTEIKQQKSEQEIGNTSFKENENIFKKYDINTSIEEEFRKCSNFKDWDIFKKPFKQEELNMGLINENTHYSDALNVIEQLERQMLNVFKDPRIAPQEKFNKIKEIGIEKSGQRAAANNILVDKFTKTIAEVVSLAKITVDKKLLAIKSSIDQMTKANVMHSEKEKLEQLILERIDTQMELLELSREVIEIYKTIDGSAEEIIENFEQSIPSQNAYINEIMKPFKRYFIPQNSTFLANKILNDLQSGKLAMGHLESKIMSMLSLLFKLCESDDTIIDYQSKLIKLLSAQKIEDIVIVDTILKNSLRLYIGASDIGRTSTCITIGKILSRRNNSLLIDLTGSSKFSDYGINPISLDEFMINRVEQQFVCVEGNAENINNIEKFIGELKLRLNYYPYINIILDVSQKETIEKLANSALTISFITNCTTRGIGIMKNCINKFDTENIARKIILIDPQIEISEIITELDADMVMYKIITIPYLAQTKACALKKMNPADIEEVSVIFENVF